MHMHYIICFGQDVCIAIFHKTVDLFLEPVMELKLLHMVLATIRFLRYQKWYVGVTTYAKPKLKNYG